MMQQKKATRTQNRIRVPFSSRPGKVIIAAKGSYRREKITPQARAEVQTHLDDMEELASPIEFVSLETDG